MTIYNALYYDQLFGYGRDVSRVKYLIWYLSRIKSLKLNYYYLIISIVVVVIMIVIILWLFLLWLIFILVVVSLSSSSSSVSSISSLLLSSSSLSYWTRVECFEWFCIGIRELDVFSWLPTLVSDQNYSFFSAEQSVAQGAQFVMSIHIHF